MGDEPTLFGKYTLLEVLGEGAMARVYRAIRSGPMGFRKEVALKLIHPELASHEKSLRALINEARMGGLLRHRNVVEIYEFDQVGDTFYIAMEMVRGWTLAQMLRRAAVRGPLPPRIVAEIAAQICTGLAHAHAACDPEGAPLHLVHRDLKPTNVLLSDDGVVKLADFGIARAATNVIRTSQGVTKGTPVYMSPEQVRGRALDLRSDLFSLASMIAEMITGRVVFQDIKVYKVLRQVASADTSAVTEELRAAMPEMVPIVQRAFQRAPDDRYRDADRMGQAIWELHSSLPGQERLRDWLPTFMEAGEREAIGTGTIPPDEWEDWATSRISVSLSEPFLDESDAISVNLRPVTETEAVAVAVADGDRHGGLADATTEEAPLAEFIGDGDETTGSFLSLEEEPPMTGERVTREHRRPPPPPSRRNLRLAMGVIAGLMALAAVAAWLSRTFGS